MSFVLLQTTPAVLFIIGNTILWNCLFWIHSIRNCKCIVERNEWLYWAYSSLLTNQLLIINQLSPIDCSFIRRKTLINDGDPLTIGIRNIILLYWNTENLITRYYFVARKMNTDISVLWLVSLLYYPVLWEHILRKKLKTVVKCELIIIEK